MDELLFPTCQSAEVSRERYDVIISRSQWIAGLFSVLTITWILVDTLTLNWPCWGLFAAARGLAAAGFLMLAHRRFQARNAAAAYYAIVVLFGLCISLVLFSSVMFWWFRSNPQTLFAEATYFNAPFLIAAGLGIFPLVGVESVLLMAVVLITMTASILLRPEILSSFSATAALWRLFLIAAIGSVSGMSQLRFLINLTEQSTRDALTQALTRKFGEEMLDSQFAMAERGGMALSVAFFDLDKFKVVNDCFGHEVGDALLRGTGQSIRRALRHQDILIRWGGEEFLVVLPQTDLAGAKTLIARIAETGIGLTPDGRSQTASIGIAERKCDGAGDWRLLVKLADQRMYTAKRAGRNRYVGPEGQPAPFIVDEIVDDAGGEQRYAADSEKSIGNDLLWATDYSI